MEKIRIKASRALMLAVVAMMLLATNFTSAEGARKAKAAPSTAVTVVSDTTDADSADEAEGSVDTTFYVGPSVHSIRIVNPDLTSPKFWKQMFGGDGFFAGSGLALLLLSVVIPLLVILLPLILIIIIIVLLVRDSRKRRPGRRDYAEYVGPADSAAPQGERPAAPASPQPAEPSPRAVAAAKDRAVIHAVLGLGIAVSGYILDWNLLTVAGIILLCYSAGQYINARRAERRYFDDDNTDISDNTK